MTKQVDYGLQFLLAASRVPLGQCLSIQQFANQSGLSFLFLQKIVRQLKQAQFVTSTHGPQGGYRLTRPIQKISLLEVIEAVEGRSGLTTCARGQHCSKEGRCEIEQKMKQLSHMMTQQLNTISLADFVTSYDTT